MFRKSLVIAILAFSLLTPSFSSLKAQTFSPEQEAQIRAINQQINDLMIQILLAQIDELKSQINVLLAQQATQANQIQTVIQQTTPVLGSTPAPTPIPSVLVEFSCSAGQLIIHNDVTDAAGGVITVWEGIDQNGNYDGTHGGPIWFKKYQPNGATLTLPPVVFHWEAKALDEHGNDRVGDKYGYQVSWLDYKSGIYDGTVCK